MLRHRTFYQQGVLKRDRFDRMLCAGLSEEAFYKDIGDMIQCLQHHGKTFPILSSRVLLLLLLSTFLMGGFLMQRYDEQKTTWLQLMEHQENYLVLLPYHASELSYYQRYLEAMNQKEKDNGRGKALRQIIQYRDTYQLRIPDDILCFLLYEAILSEDMELIQQVSIQLRPSYPNAETAKVLTFIDALSQQEQHPADILLDADVRSRWNLALLILSEYYTRRYHTGYEEAIDLCEWLQAQPDWQQERLQQTKESLQYEQSKDALSQGRLAEGAVDQLCRDWSVSIENQQRLITLYMAVFDQLPDQSKVTHRSLLRKAEQLFTDLRARQPLDGTMDAIGRQLQYIISTWG